jgi:hypothetical protein
MSNLSELLPTGGGQNAVDFVASGTLSSGQTVALNSDGTVSAVASDGIPQSLGSTVTFENASTDYISATFDSNSNKVVVSYQDTANSSYGTSVVGTVSGNSISFGTPVVFASYTISRTSSTFDSTANKVVIAFKYDLLSYGRALVGTVSGTSISFGSIAANFAFNMSQTPSVTFDSTNGKVVVAYSDAGNSDYGTAKVGTVSGTSISFGGATVFNAGATYLLSATYDTNAQKVVIAYNDGDNNGYGTAVVGTVSGTSISFGSETVFYSSGSINAVSATYDSTNSKVFIAFARIPSYYGTAVVGTVSGTSISFGTPTVFESKASYWSIGTTFDSNSNKVVIAYTEVTTTPPPTYALPCTVSGTSISFGSKSAFSNPSTFSDISPVFDSNSNKVVISYVGPNSNGVSNVFQNEASNVVDFIGITAEAISDTATGAVNVYGGINAVQTGLTIASDYYVQADGSLSTTVSTVKAGQAISATTINLMDLT